MVMLCFVLDLRSLSSSLLRDLKQSLLQLANFYAISTPVGERSNSNSTFLHDRIGLCYVLKNRISSENELIVAYSPRGNFNLRDFHHAVNNLPTNAFFPQFNSSEALCGDGDLKLSVILSDKVLYSWECHEKDITRKVILISSCVAKLLDFETRNTLMDAADKCVSVEFILFENKSNHLCEISECINNFVKQIADLENCSLQAYLPDALVLCRLVKRWLQELRDGMEQQLQAQFIFKNNLVGSISHISCNLCKPLEQVVDGFNPCQTCRCHGVPLHYGNPQKRSYSCSVNANDISAADVIENALRVGENSALLMPSFHCCAKLQEVSSAIEFSIIERTNLGTLSEGLILGNSFVITPLACYESEDIEKSELNIQLFQGLCTVLHSFDQGLICSSNCNVETLRETSFQCYYILLPSDKEVMLLRRLAGSEEVSPFSDVSQFVDSTVPTEIENSIRASLLKMEASDYNPFLYERGFHHKLNALVKESLQFGAISNKLEDSTEETSSTQQDSSEVVFPSVQETYVAAIEETIPELNLKAGPDSIQQDSSKKAQPSLQLIVVESIEEEIPELNEKEDPTNSHINEEWEQLIVTELPRKYSPACISKPKFDQPLVLISQSNRPDDKTSRILERLEVPRQTKTKVASHIITSSSTVDASMSTRKPLIPFEPIDTVSKGISAASQPIKLSQPMKPNFQRLKRKQW